MPQQLQSYILLLFKPGRNILGRVLELFLERESWPGIRAINAEL